MASHTRVMVSLAGSGWLALTFSVAVKACHKSITVMAAMMIRFLRCFPGELPSSNIMTLAGNSPQVRVVECIKGETAFVRHACPPMTLPALDPFLFTGIARVQPRMCRAQPRHEPPMGRCKKQNHAKHSVDLT
jgi:hypothetical protein